MIIEKVKKGENINQVLKRFKRKWRDRKIVQELRERQSFTKPSVKHRNKIIKASYIQKLRDKEANL